MSLITGWQMEKKGFCIPEVVSKISRRGNVDEMDPRYHSSLMSWVTCILSW